MPNALDAFVDSDTLAECDGLAKGAAALAELLMMCAARFTAAFGAYSAAAEWKLDMDAYDAAAGGSPYGGLRDLLTLVEAVAKPDYRPSAKPSQRGRMLRQAAADAGLTARLDQVLAARQPDKLAQ